MCTVLVPPGVNPIVVNKYINININTYQCTSLTEAAITNYCIPFFGNLPEDGHLEALTCRRYIVKWKLLIVQLLDYML